MKIALLTIWHEQNYGAEWQAYATIRALKELGFDVEMIDLRLSDLRPKTLRSQISSLVRTITPNERHFKRFWDVNIPSGRHYTTFEELKKNPPIADIYMVGSDQTWNPQITKEYYQAFFLLFGPENVRRVSYASSFGQNKWEFDEAVTNKVKQALSRFSLISCREKTGCEILKNEFGIEATCVIDPTLLHKNYRELIIVDSEKSCLTFYPLSRDPELESYTKKLSSRLGLKWINANHKEYLYGSIVWQRPTIQQWMEMIATSKLVVTRSFHGLVASLLYHRQFIILNNSGRSSRITDLLRLLGLENRCFSSIDAIEQARPWEAKIDYSVVDIKLMELRDNSWKYLQKIMSL